MISRWTLLRSARVAVIFLAVGSIGPRSEAATVSEPGVVRAISGPEVSRSRFGPATISPPVVASSALVGLGLIVGLIGRRSLRNSA